MELSRGKIRPRPSRQHARFAQLGKVDRTGCANHLDADFIAAPLAV